MLLHADQKFPCHFTLNAKCCVHLDLWIILWKTCLLNHFYDVMSTSASQIWKWAHNEPETKTGGYQSWKTWNTLKAKYIWGHFTAAFICSVQQAIGACVAARPRCTVSSHCSMMRTPPPPTPSFCSKSNLSQSLFWWQNSFDRKVHF